MTPQPEVTAESVKIRHLLDRIAASEARHADEITTLQVRHAIEVQDLKARIESLGAQLQAATEPASD